MLEVPFNRVEYQILNGILKSFAYLRLSEISMIFRFESFFSIVVILLKWLADAVVENYTLTKKNSDISLLVDSDEGGKAHTTFFRPTTNNVTNSPFIFRTYRVSSGIVYIIFFKHFNLLYSNFKPHHVVCNGLKYLVLFFLNNIYNEGTVGIKQFIEFFVSQSFKQIKPIFFLFSHKCILNKIRTWRCLNLKKNVL